MVTGKFLKEKIRIREEVKRDQLKREWNDMYERLIKVIHPELSWGATSTVNGLSIYFYAEDGTKHRFSGHSVTSLYRITNEVHHSLPALSSELK